MKPTKSILIGLATTASIMGGVDASVLNEQPISRIEMVANERVEAKQIGNLVETTLPWKDQAGIKVKYDLGEPTLTEKFADKRKREVITETVTDFDGGFKVDILLNEKPDTNVFCYDIEGAENYDFFYQPPLTAEEIAEGASRPPEIESSYAVYHKTLANHVLGQENYATGKVMHIPRPQVWSLSDVETKVWADMTYSEKDGLCVTVPQEFLDNATYPVRVDPTFGYTTIGATPNNGVSANTMRGSNATYTPANTGTLDSISAYISSAFTETLEFSLYTSGNSRITPSNPPNGVSSTSEGVHWETVNQAGETVSSGSSYRLFLNNSAGGINLYYDVTGSSYKYEPVTFNGAYPSTATLLDWGSSFQYSVYATFSATSSPTVTTNSATSISSTTATLNGSLTDGSASTTQHGFAWGTNATLSGGDTATTTLGATSTGAIYQTLTSLSPNTTYYFRAYAVNTAGTSTGSILNFKTTYVPSVLKYLQMDGGLTVNGGVIIK